MITADSLLFLWAEAIHTGVYRRNIKGHSSLRNHVTPHEAFYGKKPTVGHFHPFGQKCYVHIPKEARQSASRLLSRAEDGLFVGYTSKSIRRVYIPSRHTILESKNVDFAPCRPADYTNHSDDWVIDTTSEPLATPNQPPSPPQKESEPQFQTPPMKTERPFATLPRTSDSSPMRHTISASFKTKPVQDRSVSSSTSPVVTRSGRTSKPTEKVRDHHAKYTNAQVLDQALEHLDGATDAFAYTSQCSSDIPANYKEAVASPDRHLWEEAMAHELESHQSNGTWEPVLTRHQAVHNTVGSRWVYAKKYNPDGTLLRHKARLVAQGFSQVHGVDFHETYSPVARYDSLRILLRLAASCDLEVGQMDFDTAYLNSSLSTKMYMRPPHGLPCAPNTTLLLHKALYCLKQSGKEWFGTFKDHMLHQGFQQCQFDPCVFVKGTLIIAVYVDDLLLLGTIEALDRFKRTIAKRFKCKDLGQARYLLGLELQFTPKAIIITQAAYAKRILEKFGMADCNARATPLDPNTFPNRSMEDDKLADQLTYQMLVGSLNYLVTGTRWDLAFAISMLGTFNSRPNTLHMSLVKQVLRYLKATADQSLNFRRATPSNLALTMYADSSWCSDPDTSKSVNGYLLLLNNAPVNWSSKRQTCVALSTCDAEYMACAHAARHLVWASNASKELANYTSLKLMNTMPRLLSDNKPAICLSEEQRVNGKTKHIAMHYHFVRERNTIDYTIGYVSSKDNLADLCTKVLPRPLLQSFKDKLLYQG